MTGPDQDGEADRLVATLDGPLQRLEQARPFAKLRHQTHVLDITGRLLAAPGGLDRLRALAPRMDAAGIFAGSDWDTPATLRPGLVSGTLEAGAPSAVAAEAISLMRLLAIAKGEAEHPSIHAAAARRFLTQVLALNMRRFFGATDEAARAAAGRHATIDALFRYLVDHVGFQDVAGELVEEIWRILRQRPIQVAHVKDMIAQIGITLARIAWCPRCSGRPPPAWTIRGWTPTANASWRWMKTICATRHRALRAPCMIPALSRTTMPRSCCGCSTPIMTGWPPRCWALATRAATAGAAIAGLRSS